MRWNQGKPHVHILLWCMSSGQQYHSFECFIHLIILKWQYRPHLMKWWASDAFLLYIIFGTARASSQSPLDGSANMYPPHRQQQNAFSDYQGRKNEFWWFISDIIKRTGHMAPIFSDRAIKGSHSRREISKVRVYTRTPPVVDNWDLRGVRGGGVVIRPMC